MLLGCALLLIPAACKKGEEEEKAPTPVVYVQAARPQQGSISQEIAGDALLAPLAQAASRRRLGSGKEVLRAARAQVSAGQLLAVLENRDLLPRRSITKARTLRHRPASRRQPRPPFPRI